MQFAMEVKLQENHWSEGQVCSMDLGLTQLQQHVGYDVEGSTGLIANMKKMGCLCLCTSMTSETPGKTWDLRC